MRMTPALLVVGSLMVFWTAVIMAVVLPAATMSPQPSAAWRAWTDAEAEGHALYVTNGCSYCHSQFIRVVDWGLGAERIAEAGDYAEYQPAILGTERTGPDLSQAGGEHPNDWHVAHFTNPRFTRPMSLMPSWEFLGKEKMDALSAYVQSLGGKDSDFRVGRQEQFKTSTQAAYESGVDKNIEWLHAQIPQAWRAMPNPYPATAADLERGKRVYQDFCIGCHGTMGDGKGPAEKYLTPPPLNFTTLRRHLVDGKYIGGVFYYQIMNGITGTAMPYFKRELESEKIWDVGSYIAVRFVGYTDAGMEPRGIPAAYESNLEDPHQTAPPEGKAP